MGDRVARHVKRELPSDISLGTSATIVQFSSAFCQPCRATRRIVRHVVDELVTDVPGIAIVDIDADESLEVTRAWDIESTPTVVFLDASGHEVRRATGQPRTADVVAALAQVLEADS
jgi:thiol-disulfide isomerase/thioredoxin